MGVWSTVGCGGTVSERRGIKVVRGGTGVVMVVRPRIEEEVMGRLDEKVDDVMRVDPDKVGDGEKIRILIEEFEELEKELEETKELGGRIDEMSQALRSLKTEFDNPNNRL